MRSVLPLLLFLVLPLVEIAGFVIVGGAVGVLPTMLLVVATGMAGSMLLRIQGLGTLRRVSAMLEAGRNPSRELAHGLMILVAGILLIIPGFVTDLLGILLFLPPVRELAWRVLRRLIAFRVMTDNGWSSSAGRPGPPTIDLHEHEYATRRDTPWRRIDDD